MHTLTPADRELAASIARAFPLEPIGAEIAKQVRDLRVVWIAVGAAFQDDHPACSECTYCHTFSQSHPYGDTYATEYLSECTLGERGESPMQCPAINTEGEDE